MHEKFAYLHFFAYLCAEFVSFCYLRHLMFHFKERIYK